MLELVEGKIYKCADGYIRRLDKIEDRLLFYSVPIGDEKWWRWMELTGTRRNLIEHDFRAGSILAKDEIWANV